MTYDHSFPNSIIKAAEEIGIQSDQFTTVGPGRWRPLLIDIMNKFTNSDDINRFWIWSDLKNDVATLAADYGPNEIRKIFDNETNVWFIVEEGNVKKDGVFWVFEGNLDSVLRVIGNMHAFEYAIVDRKLDWMICENHHDILIATGEPAVTRLKELADAKNN